MVTLRKRSRGSERTLTSSMVIHWICAFASWLSCNDLAQPMAPLTDVSRLEEFFSNHRRHFWATAFNSSYCANSFDMSLDLSSIRSRLHSARFSGTFPISKATLEGSSMSDGLTLDHVIFRSKTKPTIRSSIFQHVAQSFVSSETGYSASSA